MHYDSGHAQAYAQNSWVSPWIVRPISEAIHNRSESATVVDVGCGTGDHLSWLAAQHPHCRLLGFDLSPEMLAIARDRCPAAAFAVADANESFPYPDGCADVLFCVYVIQHLSNYERLLAESLRVLKPNGVLLLYTNDEDDIQTRGLGNYFPETIAINRDRYPRTDNLVRLARAVGFTTIYQEKARGQAALHEQFLASLQGKALSDLRLISDEAHARGMERLRAARQRGECWISQTTILHFGKRPV
jgi:SAM-dependent methyltransferase